MELDFDFATRSIVGRTAIKIEPTQKELKEIRLRCRQMDIKSIKVDNFVIADYQYNDPYRKLTARDGFTVHQHHQIDPGLGRKLNRDETELVVPLPPKLRIVAGPTISLQIRTDGKFVPSGDTIRPLPTDDQPRFRMFTIFIEYELKTPRDGIHWVGLDNHDMRFPQVYSYTNSLAYTQASYMFPCVDGPGIKHPWTVAITCPRTIGDIAQPASTSVSSKTSGVNGVANGSSTRGITGDRNKSLESEHFLSSLTDVERSMDLQVLCSGDMEESDAPIEDKGTRRKWVFNCRVPVTARHIGFAIGPFELVDLTKYRDSDQDDKLGQSAYNVHGFCLPGRQEELKNICIPIASALDKMSTNTVFYPYETSYKICFVDDLPTDVVDTASLSICSSRLLVPEDVLDVLYDSTREVIRAAFSQWIGVKITAKEANDNWIIIGGAYFMADQFMAGLWGRNEQRFRLKMAAEKVLDLDKKKASIYSLGGELGVDAWVYDFLKLKAPTVLTMLHHRIVKSNGRNGVDKMFWRALLDDQTGKMEDGEIDTDRFMRIAEKVAHHKFDPFFSQWVFGSGCPLFTVTQRFNKKKLVVELTISQAKPPEELSLSFGPDSNALRASKASFMSEIKGEEEGLRQMDPPPLFTGPMTIRIHEADGTPYEHIVDIKEMTTKVDIPYNTKYKRLKRNKRQKERAAAVAGVDVSGDAQDDVLLYCLGDVLSTEQEMRDWQLVDWSKEDESRMNEEHYEWIRLDKDFEWIARIQFQQPHYMFVSQLQQDNDVVAQVESLQYLAKQQPFAIVSTILIRTLMDKRYYYGIRVMAAHALARCAKASLNWIGLMHLEKAFHEFYCFDKSVMTRSNDFSDLRNYAIQCAIPEAISKIRDDNGKAPDRVKQFFIDKLKFNDNSNNAYSDAFYVAKLLSSLAYSITVENKDLGFDFANHEQALRDEEYKRIAIDEIHRYRRIDEWIPSFHNLYTVTALDSMKVFMQSGALPRRLSDFIEYTKRENSDPIRIKAYDCLVELGAFRNPDIMAYFLVSFFTEPSPYVRNQLWSVMSRAIGAIARGESDKPKTVMPAAGGLVLDDDQDIQEARQNAAQTQQTLSGAIANLRSQISEIPVLKEILLEALRSPTIGMENFLDLLTLCRILYEAKDSFKITLRLPRYWSVSSSDGHNVKFKQTDRVRTRPFTRLDDRLPASMRKAKEKRPLPPGIDATDPGLASEPQAKRARISAPEGSPPAGPAQSPKATNKFPKIRLSTAPKAASPKAASPKAMSPDAPRTPSLQPSTPARATPPKRRQSHIIVLKLPPMKLAKFEDGGESSRQQLLSPGPQSVRQSLSPSARSPKAASPRAKSPIVVAASLAPSVTSTLSPPPSEGFVVEEAKKPEVKEEIKEKKVGGSFKIKLNLGRKSGS